MSAPAPSPAIRPLVASDADAFRALRLQALASAPAAFGSSYEEEAARPPEWFRAGIPDNGPTAIFGAFTGDRLIGMAGFVANQRIKQRHKGSLWGVFIKSQWRGRSLGTLLVQNVIAHASKHVLVLQTSVVMNNAGARGLYHRLGFVPYGVERKALCIDGVFHDEELLALELRGLNPPLTSPPLTG